MPKASSAPVQLGDVFYPQIIASSHFWVVAYYNTTPNQEKLVIFNFTTCCPQWHDNTCAIEPADYSELTQKSAIAYQHGRIVEGVVIGVLNGGIRRYLNPVSPAILLKIQQGALISKFTPTNQKELIRTLPGVTLPTS